MKTEMIRITPIINCWRSGSILKITIPLRIVARKIRPIHDPRMLPFPP
jgi:hypothetical protein